MQATARLARAAWLPLALAALLLAAAVLPSSPAKAEDIDLYTLGSGESTAPNVLFLLDNTSNWSANNQAWSKASVSTKCSGDATCLGYVDEVFGAETSLKQGQVELRALKLVIDKLICSDDADAEPAVNIGLMLMSANKGSISGADNSWVGGWIRKAVGSDCTSLKEALDDIDEQITAPAYKAASNANYGGAMFEAFKYFGGYTNPANAPSGSAGTPVSISAFGPDRYTAAYAHEDGDAFTSAGKTTYQSPITDACGSNYLVLVGNGFPNLEVEDNTAPKYDKMLKNLGYSGTGQVTATAANKMRYADEWAQFLANTDVHETDGQQTVVTYAVNVYNAQEDADQTALLTSIAKVGGAGTGSGYYEVGGDLKALIDAFESIFNKILAKNSVFASASLPVSVNTQGTFLNQVFIGMFRPDANGKPRWNGNVKQYQLAVNDSGDVFLADKNGDAALNNAGTGFLDICSTSFWTTDSGTYWSGVPTTQTPLNACTTSSTEPTSDAPDGDIVEKGGAGQKLRAMTPSARAVQTCTSLACTDDLVDLDHDNVTALAEDMGVTVPSADLVSWIRGSNIGDGPPVEGVYETYDMAGSVMRPTVHGDVVHARPLAINYGTGDTNDVVLFYGAGDGLFHAIDANQSGSNAGKELWSFLAPEFLTRFERLRENSPAIKYATTTDESATPKDYFFDGTTGAYQERDSTGAITKVYLYPSMRRGGRQIYAFDATTRPVAGESGTYPTFEWKFGCPYLDPLNSSGCTTGATSIGQTWSAPKPIRLRSATETANPLYLVFGGGYDTCEDDDSCGASTKGQGIFVVYASGEKVGELATYIDLTAKSTEAGRVIADVVPIDVNGDGYADVLYAVDTRGNVWRTNLSNPSATTPYTGYDPDKWDDFTHRIAKVANWSGESSTYKRKFQYAPDVVVLGGTANIFVGTGDREKPLPGSTAASVKNRFYALRDNYAEGAYELTVDGVTSIASPTLIDDSADCDAAGDTSLGTGCKLLNVTTLSSWLDYSETLKSAAVRGWVIDLTATATPYEQVITSPVTVGGVVYFSTFQSTDAEDDSSCSNLGTARGYAVDFLTGGLRKGDSARAEEFVGGGLPPSPFAGIVEIDGEKHPVIIGGRQSGGGSALEGGKVPVNIKSVRKKVYRYQKIDK